MTQAPDVAIDVREPPVRSRKVLLSKARPLRRARSERTHPMAACNADVSATYRWSHNSTLEGIGLARLRPRSLCEGERRHRSCRRAFGLG